MTRAPTEEEEKLWERIAREAKPLTRKRMAERGVRKQVSGVKKKEHIALPLAAPCFLTPDTSSASLDHRTAERLRKGDYPIDARLDMHGMSRDKAFQALMNFMQAQYGRGRRCLLVITGKGDILRQSLPQWLTIDELASIVLAHEPAQPKHGGGGAYYVLLRRKRN